MWLCDNSLYCTLPYGSSKHVRRNSCCNEAALLYSDEDTLADFTKWFFFHCHERVCELFLDKSNFEHLNA